MLRWWGRGVRKLTMHRGGALLWNPAAYKGPFHSLRTSDTLQNLTRAIKGAPWESECAGTTEVAETGEGPPGLILSRDISLPVQYRLQERREK